MCVVSKLQYCKGLPRKISCYNLQFFVYSGTVALVNERGGGAFQLWMGGWNIVNDKMYCQLDLIYLL